MSPRGKQTHELQCLRRFVLIDLPFSHALMVILQLTTFGVSDRRAISCSNQSAASRSVLFLHALTAALQLTTLGVSDW